MRRAPSKLNGGGVIQAKINELIDYAQSLVPLESRDTLIEHTARGVVRRARANPVSAAHPGGGMNYRGQWSDSPASPYLEFDVVLILTGVAAGTYITTTNNNTNDPATGIGWVQIAPGDAFGRWS